MLTKKLRYSSPGRIRGDNMNFSADENKFLSEDNSEILIMNSNFKGKLEKKGNILLN